MSVFVLFSLIFLDFTATLFCFLFCFSFASLFVLSTDNRPSPFYLTEPIKIQEALSLFSQHQPLILSSCSKAYPITIPTSPTSFSHAHRHTHTRTHTHTHTHTRTRNNKLRRWIRLCWHNQWRFSNFEMRIFFTWVFWITYRIFINICNFLNF